MTLSWQTNVSTLNPRVQETIASRFNACEQFGREVKEALMAKITKSDAEWRAQLSDLAYKVTRKHGTERAFTHDNFPKDDGMYHCVCCGAPLFDQHSVFFRSRAHA